MFGVALINIIPTLLLYLVLPKAGFKIKSNYLKLSFSWFIGMYIFTIATFLLALFLSLFTTLVLFKAAVEITVVFLIILFYYFQKDMLSFMHHTIATLKSGTFFKSIDILIVFCCLFFPILFFGPHLSYQRGAIYTSPVFWDFHWIMSLTQTFAFGDNFPPQNEGFAGLPANYHYFWMVITAIYETMGITVVQAINFSSIIGFFFFLITIVGLSQEIFKSKLAGIVAALLTVTSSSAYFIDYFSSHSNQSLTEIVRGIFASTKHPFFSAIHPINGFLYNGTMFNLFYFLEERQMILGVTYLLISAWIMYNRKHFSNRILLIIGAMMGAYFLWHLYITLMVLGALVFVLLVDKDRKQTLLLLAGFGIVFTPHYLYFKELTHSEWFSSIINKYPKFEPGFSDQRDIPFTFQHALHWYVYSYGIKLILFPISLVYLWIKEKRAAVIVAAIVIPTFIAINTIQLSPADIYENHKWLKPMNIFVDLAVAVFIARIFFSSGDSQKVNEKWDKALYTLPVWVGLLFFLTASGIIELMPFLNSKPTQFFAYYPSSVSVDIQTYTSPQATFIGAEDNDIFLAGRKLFLANTLRGHDIALNRMKRIRIINQIYTTTDLHTFCNLTKTYQIDYVEFRNLDNYPSRNFLLSLPNFSSLSQTYEKVYFVDTKKACR